jgi:hypothetical protein
MGPVVRSTNTRRRNSENDGQILGGGSIGITVREPKRGFFQEDGRKVRELPQSMRRTNDEAVHTQTQRMKENGLRHRSPLLPAAAGLLLLMTYVKTTEGRYPTICRDQSDLSKMPSFYTYGTAMSRRAIAVQLLNLIR